MRSVPCPVHTSQKPSVHTRTSPIDPTAAGMIAASGRTRRPPTSGSQAGATSPQGRTSPKPVKASASVSNEIAAMYTAAQPRTGSTCPASSSMPMENTNATARRHSPEGSTSRGMTCASTSAQRGTARTRTPTSTVTCGLPSPGTRLPGRGAPWP
ncbi:hypothetical protein [Actinophytocola oryzae]|uniref:hypothetical protein n=1 Tax=Actinophytocola oryzae TaxID=502181 RepID=UPI001414F894|nr:hypothetical protein [Actinophytocola oryzae]